MLLDFLLKGYSCGVFLAPHGAEGCGFKRHTWVANGMTSAFVDRLGATPITL